MDARATAAGRGFRVRHRPLGGHIGDDGAGGHPGDEGCEDETWVKVPSEGWLPLDQLRVSATTTAEQLSRGSYRGAG
jgi:hypothetical protein